MSLAGQTGELFLAALPWRPVWMRYGLYGSWHALIKNDIAVIADLRKPTCGAFFPPEQPITGTGLVPGDGPICSECLKQVVNV